MFGSNVPLPPLPPPPPSAEEVRAWEIQQARQMRRLFSSFTPAERLVRPSDWNAAPGANRPPVHIEVSRRPDMRAMVWQASATDPSGQQWQFSEVITEEAWDRVVTVQSASRFELHAAAKLRDGWAKTHPLL